MLEAAQESLREHMRLLKDYRKELANATAENAQQKERIAELEAKTVKLPDEIIGLDCDYKLGWNECRETVWDLNQPTPQGESDER